MRKIKIQINEYYHLYNRGNNKQPMFLDTKDWERFLFYILYLQSPVQINRADRKIKTFLYDLHRVWDIVIEVQKNRFTELTNFSLMPNHFHLTVRESKEDGISRYMQRVLNAYTRYFNTKYEKSGHLFQGPFQLVHIKDNNQLLYLSTYIHRNPRELKTWRGKEHLYPWSSYQDYLGKNRWPGLLKTDIIAKQFSGTTEYKNFVDTSAAKDRLFTKEFLFD